jgi:hypothetical protein
MELRLKSYKVLKLQGLDCKIVGLDCIRNSNPRASSEFRNRSRLWCKIYRIKLETKLFLNGISSGPSSRNGGLAMLTEHGGLADKVWPVLAERRYVAQNLAMAAQEGRVGHNDPHCGQQPTTQRWK